MADPADEFKEWITRGPGEEMLGHAVKTAAGSEKHRLTRRLAIPNLFPHIEHEDQVALERAEIARQEGQRMMDRCRARKSAIDGLLDADAGLQISADDLKPE